MSGLVPFFISVCGDNAPPARQAVPQPPRSARLPAQSVPQKPASGVVSLFGTVPDRSAHGAAERSAGSVPGATSVLNRLVLVKGS